MQALTPEQAHALKVALGMDHKDMSEDARKAVQNIHKAANKGGEDR